MYMFIYIYIYIYIYAYMHTDVHTYMRNVSRMLLSVQHEREAKSAGPWRASSGWCAHCSLPRTWFNLARGPR